MNNWEDLSALADDQLEASKAADLRMQMEANPSLRSQYESILSVKRSLRNNLPSHDSPETLSLCLDRVRELDTTTRTENVVHKFRHAIAGGLAMLIAGAAIYNQTGPAASLDSSAIAKSISAGFTGGSNSINTAGPAEVWLRDNLAAAAIGENQLRLIRAQQLMVDGRPIGRYQLTDGIAEYVYLIAPGIMECDGKEIPGYDGLKLSEVNGMNAITWCENNASFAFISSEPVSEMLEHVIKR